MARLRRSMMVTMVVATLLWGALRPALAADDDHRFATDLGYGVGSIFTNVVYMPVKFVYATLGGITGGFAYVLTGLRMDIAKGIWVPSLGGTYVVTPAMLKGEDRIYFSGVSQPRQAAARGEEDLPADGKVLTAKAPTATDALSRRSLSASTDDPKGGGMMKTWIVAASVLAVLMAGCSPKLEEGEILEKKGDTFTIKLQKTLDEPIDKVWASFQRPEDLEKYSEQYQQTKLLKSEGNTKVIDYRVSALGQVNAFTMELTMDPEKKHVGLKTLESSLVDITGEYDIQPGPGGKGTIVTYRASQKDKANIPVPVSVQKTAIKESFDNLIAAIKKGIQAQGG